MRASNPEKKHVRPQPRITSAGLENLNTPRLGKARAPLGCTPTSTLTQGTPHEAHGRVLALDAASLACSRSAVHAGTWCTYSRASPASQQARPAGKHAGRMTHVWAAPQTYNTQPHRQGMKTQSNEARMLKQGSQRSESERVRVRMEQSEKAAESEKAAAAPRCSYTGLALHMWTRQLVRCSRRLPRSTDPHRKRTPGAHALTRSAEATNARSRKAPGDHDRPTGVNHKA
jgi:hypothetical protein